MHELSIALQIVEIAEREAKKEGASEVTGLELDVGTLSGVVIEALEFAMKEAVKETILERAVVNILEIPAEGICNQCENRFSMKELYDLCPMCNSTDRMLIRGQELQVRSLKIK